MVRYVMGPAGSILLHIVLVVALVKLVLFEPPSQEPEVEVILMEPESADLQHLQMELEQLEKIHAIESLTAPDLAPEPEAPPDEISDFSLDEPEMDFAALDVADTVQSPLVMRGLYASRSDEGRQNALNRHAGHWGRQTEPAVLRALEWLKQEQHPDGSWDEKYPVALTSMSLLTYLAHGETPSSEKYGETVEKAIRYLVETQREDGSFDKPGGNDVYGHGVATYAISEAYGLTRIPALKVAMEKAVKIIIDGQQPGGGWDYFFKQNTRRDTSVAGWFVQALKAARLADADIPGLDEALAKAAKDLKSAQKANGRFWYSNNPDTGTIGLTGLGVLCLQLMGQAEDEATVKGLEYLVSYNGLEVDWASRGSWPLYGWYYITQALFHDGSKFNTWNDKFAEEFVRNQSEDGSWTPPPDEEKYGRVYGTTLAALTLQVYYRLLPTFQERAVDVESEDDAPDELLIEVI